MENDNQSDEVKIEIETLMQSIRQQYLVNSKLKGLNEIDVASFPMKGEALSNKFYENLYQVALLLEESIVEPEPIKIRVPLIGPFLYLLRSQIHNLVVYYVLKTNTKHAKTTATLFKTVVLLVNEYEALAEKYETLQLGLIDDA